VIELTDRHRAILLAVGIRGADETEFGYARSREFDDLTKNGFVVYWPRYGSKPRVALVGGRPGAWCLTLEGATAVDLAPPFRTA